MEDLGELLAWLVGTFTALVAAGIPGVPIPEAVPVTAAGVWLGAHTEIGILGWILLPVCILGIVIADSLLYCIGRFFGARLLNFRMFAKLLAPERRSQVEENFHKYGMMALLFARLMPSLPSVVSITAGTMRVPYWRFVLADTVYAIPGIGLLFFLAFWFGAKIMKVVENANARVHEFQPYIILAVIAAIAGYFIYHFYRRPIATGDPKDIPIIGDQVAAKIAHETNLSHEIPMPHSASENGTPNSAHDTPPLPEIKFSKTSPPAKEPGATTAAFENGSPSSPRDASRSLEPKKPQEHPGQ